MSSVQRLRWVLVAVAVLLVGVLAAYIGYGRYRQIAALRRILQKSGVHITRDTNGVTYSQSVGGKTIFTLHAAKATQIGDGKWALHDAEMTLYGRMPERPDHIYGAEFEYDEKEGVARALGEVHMDLEAPQSVANGKAADPLNAEAHAESTEVIHVRTSGLVYLRRLGVAATDQAVEFRYGGVECTAVGAEFNTNQNILHLLANVQMDGVAHGKPMHMTAARADLDRTTSTANLVEPVVTSGDGSASAHTAVLNVRKDGSIERLVATGDVLLRTGTQEIGAARLDAVLNERSVPETAKMSGGVTMVDRDARRPMDGKAAQVDVAFDAQGAVKKITGTGGVMLSSVDRVAGGGEDVNGLARGLKGQTMVATFVPTTKKSKTRLSDLLVTGDARGRSESLVAPSTAAKAGAAKTLTGTKVKTEQIAADNLHVVFGVGTDGKVSPRRLYGTGHTLLQQDAPMEEREVSTGDTLDATLSSAPVKGNSGAITIASVVQTGHIEIHSRAADKVLAGGKIESGEEATASATRAEYNGTSERLTLTGAPRLSDKTATMTAGVVVVDQRTGDAEAHGAVETAMEGSPGSGSGSGSGAGSGSGSGLSAGPQPVTHVLSSSARFVHATQLMEFKGTDAEPAKMWQDASQVDAATLLLDGVRRTFSARPAAPGGLVHAVFAGKATQAVTAAKTEKKSTSEAGKVVRVSGRKMDYSEAQREATFTGNVRMDGDMGEVTAQQAVVFLSQPKAGTPKPADSGVTAANPLGGSLDRAVAYGDVQLVQPGRQGVGDQLTYTAAMDSFVLTGTAGHPPHIVDAQQGNVTGTTLVFGQSGSTIVVAGDTAPGKSGHGRVRTETEVRP
jgi:lipopolysaccharide export system protein LptA